MRYLFTSMIVNNHTVKFNPKSDRLTCTPDLYVVADVGHGRMMLYKGVQITFKHIQQHNGFHAADVSKRRK